MWGGARGVVDEDEGEIAAPDDVPGADLAARDALPVDEGAVLALEVDEDEAGRCALDARVLTGKALVQDPDVVLLRAADRGAPGLDDEPALVGSTLVLHEVDHVTVRVQEDPRNLATNPSTNAWFAPACPNGAPASTGTPRPAVRSPSTSSTETPSGPGSHRSNPPSTIPETRRRCPPSDKAVSMRSTR